MLNTALVVALGGGLAGQVTYPDQIDILRGADTTPQIELVLDTSGSMGPNWGCFPSTCSYYYSSVSGRDCTGTGDPLSKNDQIKAALTGCTSPADGILDKWDQRVLFSIREFGGSRTGLLAEFDTTFSNHGALESAVLGLQNDGGTPMAEAYVRAGEHMNSFWTLDSAGNGNTAECRRNYVVLMTDGDGNGYPRNASWISGPSPITVSDAGPCFPSGCGSPYDPPFSDAFAAYMFDGVPGNALNPEVDALTNVFNSVNPDGTINVQPIRTYTIAFQAPIVAQQVLQAVANEGDGRYYNAGTYQQLDNAFTQIITEVASRSNVTFTAGSIQADGVFSSNYIYSSAFLPTQDGPWTGTTRKYCVLPSSPTDDTCIFYYPNGDVQGGLFTNPNALDIWSNQIGAGARTQAANVGGSGLRIWNDLFNVASANDTPPSSPLGRRNIYTWRHGTIGYVRVDGTNLTPTDTWTNSLCEHYSLLNRLHGYSYGVADCAAGNYAPMALESWPQGDTVNGASVVIKYTPNCETASDRCFVATVANDGMLHFFDAYSGVETSAIIPPDFWTPSQVAHHTLSSIMQQPNLEVARKFYFDGRVRLFHDDNGGVPFVAGQAGNGVIDTGEPAHLIAPLGRGGAAYISFPMTQFSGVPDPTPKPPPPIYTDSTTRYKNLQDTWAAPWIGRFRYQGRDQAVAVFSNGHRREEDQPTAQLGAIQDYSGRPGSVLDTRGNPIMHSCSTAASNANWTGVNSAVCDPLGPTLAFYGYPNPSSCVAGNTGTCGLGLGLPLCCYDWSGWAAVAPAPWDFSTTGGAGHNIIYGPFSWQSGTSDQIGVAYRVGFDRFHLQPGDYIAILDSQQREVGRISGNGTDLAAGGPIYTPWVTDTSFYLQIRTNGVDDASSVVSPFNIFDFHHLRRATRPPQNSRTYPTIYVVDVNRWNGPNLDGSGGQGFSALPTNARQAEAVLARISSRCVGAQGSNETCVDATTNANTTDLQYMTCGISSELSVYTEGDLLRTIYFIDRCGQIFKVDYNLRNLSNPWSARRLLNLNNTSAGAPILGASKDYRQGFAQLELVLSQCNGARSVGVYFGTGNLQRAAEFDNLMDGTITSHGNNESTFTALPPAPSGTQWRDVIGVVWDSPTLPPNASLRDLVNVTSALEVTNPAGTNGFFIELEQNEKMLRKPLVLEGVAFFQTYRPYTPATECVSAQGEAQFYVFNNCTARPLVDGTDIGTAINGPGDRVAFDVEADIGGELLAVFPKGRAPIVSPSLIGGSGGGGGGDEAVGELPTNPSSRGLKLFMWRKIQ